MNTSQSDGSRGDWSLGAALLVLVGALVLFEFTKLDLWLQDHFYHFDSHQWTVDEDEPIGRAFFYNGPRAVVWLIGFIALALAVGPFRWRERWKLSRRGLWLAVLVLVTVPVLAGIGKKYTNTFCPSEIRRYGGEVAYAKLCEPFPPDDRPAQRGGCFPAGHASGGFALFGLVAVRANARWLRGVVAAGLGLGWWMGAYQMLKGAHYLSHTVTTMLLAWIVVALWRRALGIPATV